MNHGCHDPHLPARGTTLLLGAVPLGQGCRPHSGSDVRPRSASRRGCLGAAVTVLAMALTGCSSSSSSSPAAAPSQVPSQTSPDATALAGEVSTIRATLQTAVDAHVFPGAVVVVRRGTRTRTVAVGRADVVTHSPMTAADRFRLASVTKSMVAAVALQLVADGRLSLSDTVDRWEPGLLAHGGDITVAELLGQTSGLPAFQSTRAFARLQGSPPPQKLVDMVAQAPLMFAPGSRSWYSNTNYLVLGMILQKVSHEPLAALLQHRLFDPLGLHSAGLAATRVNTPPLAHGYDHGRDVTFTAADLTWLWAAGGVVANAQDVARFYDALLSGRIVRGPLLQRMLEQRPETNHDLPFSGYGLGVATLPTGCGQAYGHSGDAPGFMTHAWTTRNGKRSVVMIENTSLTVSVNDYIVSVLNEALCSP